MEGQPALKSPLNQLPQVPTGPHTSEPSSSETKSGHLATNDPGKAGTSDHSLPVHRFSSLEYLLNKVLVELLPNFVPSSLRCSSRYVLSCT